VAQHRAIDSLPALQTHFLDLNRSSFKANIAPKFNRRIGPIRG
jgi:hypothetical protein